MVPTEIQTSENQLKVVDNKLNRKNHKSLETDLIKQITSAYKVTGINQKNGNGEYEIIPLKSNKQFLFTKKTILEVNDGKITNTWHIKEIVDDGVDLFVYKTEEGLDISSQGFLLVAYPDGTTKSYEVNEIDKKQLNLK